MRINEMVNAKLAGYEGLFFPRESRVAVANIIYDGDFLEIELENGADITIRLVKEIEFQQSVNYEAFKDFFITDKLGKTQHIRFEKV